MSLTIYEQLAQLLDTDIPVIQCYFEQTLPVGLSTEHQNLLFSIREEEEMLLSLGYPWQINPLDQILAEIVLGDILTATNHLKLLYDMGYSKEFEEVVEILLVMTQDEDFMQETYQSLMNTLDE